MNLAIDSYIKGKKAKIKHRLLQDEALDDPELTLLIQIEILEKIKNIERIIEQEQINKGYYPK